MDLFDVKLPEDALRQMSTLGLAHVGDAVYELLVRSWLCAQGRCSVQGLHKAAVSYVRAPRQAAFAEKLLPFLTEEEAAVYRRGRNAKVNSLPKHASPGEYHAATGLETLFGWLYLRGDKPRINRLFEIITEE